MSDVVLRVENLKKHYLVKKIFKAPKFVKAVDGVSFELHENETLAIVGESGCGKTTLAKALIQIEAPTDGTIALGNKDFRSMGRLDYLKQVQMIFQDPYSSINPRKTAWKIIAEPLMINTNKSMVECRAEALETMKLVGLRPEFADRYPHMFSGGQRQRIGIARALMLKPRILLCDEPVSALDVSIQAQVLNLLMDLQDARKLSYIFISHDLSVVRHISDRILVMYLGKIAEAGTSSEIFLNPKHPYTKALLLSTPKIKKAGEASLKTGARGELPSPLNPPSGCAFHKRCPLAQPICSSDEPKLRDVGNGTKAACHFVETI